MTKFEIIKRVGYGASFNNIYIDITTNKIKKKAYNKLGKKKIKYEINFLKYIIENNIDIPIPKIYNFYKYKYIMENMTNYIPLYKNYANYSDGKKKEILNMIYTSLNKLHSFEKIKVSKKVYFTNLMNEIENKLLERYDNIKHIISKYDFIKKINNKLIINFYVLISMIKNKIEIIINKYDDYYFVPIHGDCQFNNILYNQLENKICFIDPRGYFGNEKIYGIVEYDMAKILLALSGYDEFDNRQIDILDIDNDNINVYLNLFDKTILEKKEFDNLLMLTLWMSNCAGFMSNENKMIYSYFIGLHLGTLLFEQ